MSLLPGPHPYGPRDEGALLEALHALTLHHLRGCPAYARVWPRYAAAASVEELPWLHVGLFKQVDLATRAEGIKHQRTLRSSSTSGQGASRIRLDARSSELQAASTLHILRDFVGEARRPLLVLDGLRSLQRPGEVSARAAAALSLRPLASDLVFALDDADRPESLRWDALRAALAAGDELLIYGFTWALWLSWTQARWPEDLAAALRGKRAVFVHSGGWKRLEAQAISRERFDAALLATVAPDSKVVDYYGLVEQVGVIYPLCEAGFRHVPRWAEVIVRGAHDLRPRVGEPGQLQLLNTLAQGAPYHSVLTEDLGRIEPGPCACGRSGRRFTLLGRVPKAEVRGCANV